MNTALGYLGNIPDGWNLVHLGRLTSEVRTLNSNCSETNDLQFKMGNIISKSTGDSKYHPETLEEYTIVAPGDVVVNGLNLNYDLKSLRVGQVRENGVITSSYIIVRPEKIDADYVKYLLQGFDSIKTFHGMGKGIRLTLGYEELRRMYIPVPPPLEQSRIATFLDEHCGKIDEAIAKYKALIDKLDEYRKAVITEAVTKGVRGKSVFNRVPIKHVARYNLESLPESTPKDFEFDYVDISSVSYEKGVETKERMMFENAPSRARRQVKPNDVIISTVRTYLKAVAQIPAFETPLIVSTGFIVMTAIESKIMPSYLGYAVKSERFIDDVQVGSYGISYPAIKVSELVNMKIDLPTIAEQQEIVAYLDEKCAAIDATKERHAQLMAKLEEYKKSLIYNSVTGKIEC